MGFRNRAPKSPEERMAENIRLVGRDIASALPENPRPWWKEPHLLRLNMLLLVVMMAAATVGYDGAMMNALQINLEWKSYYNNPAKAKLGAINAMMPAGKIIGFFFVAPFSNRFGRKKALCLAFIITVIGAVIQAVSINLGLLIFARFILGFGCGVMSQPSPILLAELAYPTQRGKITALYHCFYFIGAIAAAWITFGTLRMSGSWSWRIPTLLQGAAPLMQLIFSYWLPESPRFLVAKGRDEEARALLVKYHAAGDENSSLVEHEMIQIRAAVRDQYNQEKRPSLKKMVSSPANRMRLIISGMVAVSAQWSGNTVVSYYLTLVLDGVGIKNATHQSLINGGLQIFNLLATVGCGAMLVDVLGRRRLFQWSAIGMTVSYIIWTILNSRFDATGSASFGYAVIPMLFIFYFHYDIALTPLLYSYPTELFPYEWRSWGVAFTLIITNVVLIIGQVCNPIALAQLGWKYYILFCVLDAIFIVEVWFLFPETKGKSLEELADIFGRLDRKAPTDPGSNEVAMEETVKHEMDKGNIVHVDSR
uniref:Major facilitator superfamily (MFS) profile domain-containing protein n=1 Tax=Bionectria ochroleuca TaxID=29856 RepID=A0A0B7KI59_BIOOC